MLLNGGVCSLTGIARYIIYRVNLSLLLPVPLNEEIGLLGEYQHRATLHTHFNILAGQLMEEAQS